MGKVMIMSINLQYIHVLYHISVHGLYVFVPYILLKIILCSTTPAYIHYSLLFYHIILFTGGTELVYDRIGTTSSAGIYIYTVMFITVSYLIVSFVSEIDRRFYALH